MILVGVAILAAAWWVFVKSMELFGRISTA